MKISAKTKSHPVPVVVDYDLPTGIDAKVKKYGADVVDAMAEDSIIINIQALVRRLMGSPEVKDAAGKVTKAAKAMSSQADIQAAVTAWNPSVRTMVRQSAFEKATSSLDKLTPEERKQLLAKLQALK